MIPSEPTLDGFVMSLYVVLEETYLDVNEGSLNKPLKYPSIKRLGNCWNGREQKPFMQTNDIYL